MSKICKYGWWGWDKKEKPCATLKGGLGTICEFEFLPHLVGFDWSKNNAPEKPSRKLVAEETWAKKGVGMG